jgi:hypothetical protein
LLIGLSKESARRVTAAALILANLMPLLGVALLRWELGTLLFAYWLESAVVGFFNVIKMAQAEGPELRRAPEGSVEPKEEDLRRIEGLRQAARSQSGLMGRVLRGVQDAAEARVAERAGATAEGPPAVPLSSTLAKVPLIAFFLVHYGIFMAVHGVFLYTFFRVPRLPLVQWLLTTLLLFTSHGVSYLVYFLGRGEYRAISPSQQMARPYGRIVLMHITIILGGVLLQTLHGPTVLLALLVGIKIMVDLIAHFRSHARYEDAVAASTA